MFSASSPRPWGCHEPQRHCPGWPGTAGNPGYCPGPQPPGRLRSRNTGFASQGWRRSRGWSVTVILGEGARVACGTRPSQKQTGRFSGPRRSRPLGASGPPCWPDSCRRKPRRPHQESSAVNPLLGGAWPQAAASHSLLPPQACILPPSIRWGTLQACFPSAPPVCRSALQKPIAQPGSLASHRFSEQLRRNTHV